MNVADIKLIPLVFAGWLRYLVELDDNGNKIKCSSDPILEFVGVGKGGLRLGNTELEKVKALVEPLLRTPRIFGVDLYEVGMGETVCQMFTEMMAGPGAVRATLEKYVG